MLSSSVASLIQTKNLLNNPNFHCLGDILSTKVASIGSLSKGSYIVIDGVACKVTDTQVSRPGKHGHAKVRLTAVGLLDDKKRVIVMPGHDNVDVPIVDKRTAQVLSLTSKTVNTGNEEKTVKVANVMDSETYETFDLEVPEELEKDVVEGSNVLYWVILNDKVMKQVKD